LWQDELIFCGCQREGNGDVTLGSSILFLGGLFLKSIPESEYKVLSAIAATTTSGSGPLLNHISRKSSISEVIQLVDYCLEVDIQQNELDYESSDPRLIGKHGLAKKLALEIPEKVLGKWRFHEEQAVNLGVPVYAHHGGTLVALWCKHTSRWAMLPKGMNPKWCKYRKDRNADYLYRHLKIAARGLDVDASVIHAIHGSFMQAFQEKNHFSGLLYAQVARECTAHWYPATLINDFVLAFKYQTSSTWMVVQNSVTAVSQALERHGITKFHKRNDEIEIDVFDVKPLPIISDQRQKLFGMNFVRSSMKDWKNWVSVRTNLFADVKFMDNVLANPLVDYSLLVSVFYVDDSRMVLDHVNLPKCIERRLSQMHRDIYGDAEGSMLVCFTVIDLLMEFTLAKTPENALLFGKWSNWGKKIMHMFDCLGAPLSQGCSKYAEYLPKYDGVDIDSIATAKVVDVTEYFNADNEVTTSREDVEITKKCCCHPGRDYSTIGTCVLAATIKDHRNRCASLVAPGWHSYHIEAKRCRIHWRDAASLREEVVAYSL